MSVHSNDFLSKISGSDGKFLLSLPILWGVTIDGGNLGGINSVLSDAGEKWQAKYNTKDYMDAAKNTILVAQEVTIPNESSNFSAPGVSDSTGGFMPGFGLQTRATFLDRTFTIEFLETNDDLEYNFFRPWMIAMGIHGLIEDGKKLKSIIEVQQFNNQGARKKGYRFVDAFPITVDGFTLNYENTDFTVKKVTFACKNYQPI